MADIEIKTKDFRTKVLIDGKEVNGITKLNFSQEPGQVPILSLSILADKMTIDSPALLALPEIYRSFYERKEPIISKAIDTTGNPRDAD